MMFSLDDVFFGNVGKKIKAIIRGCFYAETGLVILSVVVLEIQALIDLLDTGYGEFFGYMLLIPIIAALSIGILWLSTLMAYGFAEIVDTAVTNRLNSDGEANVVSEGKPKKTLTAYFSGYKAEGTQQTAPQGPAINGQWKCTCGKVNPPYMSSCACGKTAREIREMNKNQNN